MLTPQELTQYPIASISILCDRASDLAAPTVTSFLRELLTRMNPPYPQALAAAIDSLLTENQKLRDEIAELKRQLETHGGLGDK